LKLAYSRKNRDKDEKVISRKDIKNDLKAARKEVNIREKEVVKRLLNHSTVVMSTCVGAGSKLIADIEFDLVVIDEAAQGLEAACWIPILLGKKVVLAGDHCQLPPTIKSKEAESGGLNITLFERIIHDRRYENVCTLLNIQYRMNDLINQWASTQMYRGEVVSADMVAEHSLGDLISNSAATETINNEDNGLEINDAFPVLFMIDSSGCLMYEDAADGSVSHRNMNEAQLVAVHTMSLLSAGVHPKDIGIITPYNGQLEVLRLLFAQLDLVKIKTAFPSSSPIQSLYSLEALDIKTIDGFQGGEKECIIISLVRSNERREVGFLGENRRINVAVTRAKRHLAVICDTDTCSNDAFIKTLLDHFELHGQVIGAEDFLSEQGNLSHLLPANLQSTSNRTIPTNTHNAGNKISKEPQKKSSSKKQPVLSSKTTFAKPTHAHTSSSADGNIQSSKLNTNDKAMEEQFLNQIESLFIRLKSDEHLPSNICLSRCNITVQCVVDDITRSRRLVFPASLTSYQRMMVHSISEKLFVEHVSIGEGSDRHVEVYHSPIPPIKAQNG
jgi:ATP-dependent RNA/DNA helicase IGHMBP2